MTDKVEIQTAIDEFSRLILAIGITTEGVESPLLRAITTPKLPTKVRGAPPDP
jgi:hypothetical protein